MELLERYLQAVRFFLPKQQQDDIVRELSENLVSEMEDAQEARGRPLTEDEQADILRRHGHPMVVAGRYRTRQQLIGPVFFPIYLLALEVGLSAALLVSLLLAAMGAILTGDPVRHFVQGMLALPGRALMVFAWTTLGFAVTDFAQSRLKLGHTWDPRALPKVVSREHWTSRTRAVFELLVYVAALVWLLLLPGAPHLLLGAAARILEVAPVWREVYVPIVLLTAGAAALRLLEVVRPYWTPARSLARIALQAGGLAVIAVLLRGGEWLVVQPGATLHGGAPLDRVVDVVNRSCEIGLAIAAVVSLIEIGREVYRLRIRHRAALPSDSTQAGITR